MEILNKIKELKEKREKEAFETAKELATFDEKGKPTIRKVSKEVGKKLLLNPTLRMKCGRILFSSLRKEMLAYLKSRVPENASMLKKAAMGVANVVKAEYHANTTYNNYLVDSSLLGYVINRAKERFGNKKQQNIDMVNTGPQR